MPQQDDGMEKRRQKREAQRKRRQAQVLRMRLTLLLVVVLLAACGFGIYKLTQNAGGEDRTSVQQTVPTTEETRETTPIQKSPITTIHIKAAGDLNVTDAVVNAGMAVNSYDFSPVFKDVAVGFTFNRYINMVVLVLRKMGVDAKGATGLSASWRQGD